MPARPSRPRQATGNSLADQVARNVERMGAPKQTVWDEIPGLTYFTAVPVRLLRDFPDQANHPQDTGERAKAGRAGEVTLFPHGGFYLTIDDRNGERRTLTYDAYDGTDFDFTGQRL